MKRIGVLLSGCGFKDGAEIHESVLTLLALDRAGAEVICMAPNVEQARVVDHLTGEAVHEKRNVLTESARIARGAVRDVAGVRADELDGLALPGGFGAALNLSDFAEKGPAATVHPDVRRLIVDLFHARKPMAAICIAPAVLAAILGKNRVKVTIGTDAATAKAVEACGAEHVSCAVEGAILDEAHKIVSTPAYMLGPSIRHVAAGIDLCISELMRMA